MTTSPPPSRPARLHAVAGACGGAGASVLAAAVARTLRRTVGPAIVVDLDGPGGGLDVLLGIEKQPGARWGDLAGARGTVDGAGLLAALPRWGALPVLSTTRGTVRRPDDEVVLDVATAVLSAGHHVVLDVGRAAVWTAATHTLLTAAGAVTVVVPTTTSGVAGALTARAALSDVGVEHWSVVARRPAPGRVDPAGLERALERPVAAVADWDGRCAAAVERGDGPRVTRRSPLGSVARRLLEADAGASRAVISA